MPNNYILLEKIVVGSAGASSVTFANIPQTGYTDLVVKASARGTSGSFASLRMTVNGATTNYSSRRLYGDGSSAASDTPSSPAYLVQTPIPSASETANTFSNSEYYIPNYAGSSNKSISFDSVGENNATTAYDMMVAGLWSQTTALSSISLFMSSGDLAANSTFYLYGVAKLGTTPTIAPKATGGDVVMTDGTYWYHAFRASGTFVPQVALTADVLVIAGGGGGGCDQTAGTSAAGGGAGGILYATGQSLSTQASVTIGAGGAGKANSSAGNGTNGSNSIFTGVLTYTGVGGGGGAGFAGSGSANGNSGGSGGGGVGPSGTGGTVTQNSTNGTGYGNAGGVKGGGNNGGAGGGGAGAVGGSNNGGAGLNTWSAWATATTTGVSGFYAGGGGGRDGFSPFTNGTGGAGGGGNYGGANSGVANTGSGGGGGGGEGGAAGGSGIVIVRYLVA
jgi:hypothetical protein